SAPASSQEGVQKGKCLPPRAANVEEGGVMVFFLIPRSVMMCPTRTPTSRRSDTVGRPERQSDPVKNYSSQAKLFNMSQVRRRMVSSTDMDQVAARPRGWFRRGWPEDGERATVQSGIVPSCNPTRFFRQ
ncbi:MAG: hypothetical protein ACTHKB_10215, partial [Burkholderiaceae bacterium]